MGQTHNSCSDIVIRDNVRKYINTFFNESGTFILSLIKKYKIDGNKRKSMLKNVFKDSTIKKSLENNLESLLGEYNLQEEFSKIFWYAFSSNTNPDFDILLQRFMISVPEHAIEFEEKIDERKWGLLENPKEKELHEKYRLGIYARYRTGKIPRDIDRVILINANEEVGINLENNWRRNVISEEKNIIFYQWMDNEDECNQALFSANSTINNDEDRKKFYEYMKFIWSNIDKGEKAMLLYTAKPIAYTRGGIPENSIGEVYLAEYNQPLCKTARDIILDYLENIALILHAQFASEDNVELGEKAIFQDRALYATRAAISQVMARNTSHNIGAHVMNKLIDGLEKIDLSQFRNYESDQDLPGDDKNIFKQIAFFNNYVKCRMDYLSDISFGTPMMQTNKYAYAELFKELDKVRLLLEHISGLSGFNFKIDFKNNGKKLNDENDLLLAIPNDILGAQAFNNILENIIRNTAKHSDKTKLNGGMVVFTVNFVDDFPADSSEDVKKILTDFIAVEVYDNVPIDNLEKLVIDQNNKLNDDILNHNRLRASSLGLVEMDASAAYLRKKDVLLINDSKYDIESDVSWQNKHGNKYFQKAFNKVEGQNKYLAYRFFLLRPAVILAIWDRNYKKKIELRKQGVWVVTTEEFEKHLSDGIVYNHEFVVFSNEGDNNKKRLIENNKTSLPIRILEIDQSQLNELLNSKETNEKKILDIWEEFCWEEWIYNKFSTYNLSITNGYNFQTTDFQAVFLDHLYSNNGTTNIQEQKKQNIWDYHKQANFVEALSSLAQPKMPDFYKITNVSCLKSEIITERFKFYINMLKSKTTTKQKIQESVISKVIVIDERIQEAAFNRSFMGIQFKVLYEKINVIIPDKSLNLSENTYKSDHILKIENYIKNEIDGLISSDFLLIHYSILERMYDKEKIDDKLDMLIDDSKVTVVITSGRGTPDNLSDKRRFVNLSSVITAFIDIRCKYVINYILHSSRKSIKI